MRLKSFIPLAFFPGCRAKGVSVVARITDLIFGSPNVRRANGIISTRFDLAGALRSLASRAFPSLMRIPIFSIDRLGTEAEEGLPRIWLSERVSNTFSDNGRRVFVESYPTTFDRRGDYALELGDRYLGEGYDKAGYLTDQERKQCFQAAEILYLHAVRRGSRQAASRLHHVYSNDLCSGDYFKTYLELRAHHCRPRRMLSIYAPTYASGSI